MKMMNCRSLLLLSAASLMMGGCKPADSVDPAEAPVATSPRSAALYADGSNGDNWPGYGRTYGEQHFSPNDQINSDTVSGLGLAWFEDLPSHNAATVPIAVDGTVYVAYGLTMIRAIDARTGKMLWEYDSQTGENAGPRLRQGWGIRGLSYWNGKVFAGTADGRLVAVDVKTGKEAWSVDTLDGDPTRYISGAPRVFAGRIIIGHGGADAAAVRGYVTTYDAETGRKLWRFYTVPGDPARGFEDETQKMAAKTWAGEWWKYGGGGNAWNAFTYDADSDTILIGTGNGAPWNHKIRSDGKGDNLFVCSMVALDAKTGKYKWHYQFNPGETWDYNAAMDMHLATLDIGGTKRKVVITAPKNGFLYVIDRTNGKLISADKFAKVTWASQIDLATGRPVENPAARFPGDSSFEMWPSPIGAHSWMPSALSPQSGLVYIPKLETGAIYNDKGIARKNWKRTPGNAMDMGVNLSFDVSDPINHTSYLLAWDPVAKRKVWEIKTFGGWNGGILATGGGLVFQGQLDGRFSAYSATKGKELWHFDAQNAVLGAPISYRVDGEQYVTVVAGMGTSAATFQPLLGGLTFDYRTQKRRVLTFRLGGRSSLPTKPKAATVSAVLDPDYRPDVALAQRGAATYGRSCGSCHGVSTVAGGAAPDLRASMAVLDEAVFRQIVHDGALVSAGMPRFDNLTDQDLRAIRQYVRANAASLRSGAAASIDTGH